MNTFARNSGAGSTSPGFVTLLITLVLGFTVGFFVCYAWLSPRLEKKTEDPAPAAAGPAVPAPVETALTGLLAELQPGRHLFLGIEGKDLSPEYAELLGHIRPGGVVLRPENVESPEQASRLVARIKKALGEGTGATDLPLILGDPDALGMGVPTSFAELVAARDTGRALETGRAIAAAFETYGIRVALGPSLAAVDGVDPDALSAVGLSFADGLAQGGVLPVVKGYPGRGADGQVAVLSQDVNGLASILLPFTETIGHGVPGVFVEHVAVPALDIRYPDRPASLSPVLVRRLLRAGAQPYEGVVVAADLASAALGERYRPEGAAVEALSAGCDAVVLLDTDAARIRAVCAAIAGAVQEGILPRERLDESKARLDDWKSWIETPKGLEGPLPDVQPLAGSETVQTPVAPVVVPEAVQTPTAPVVEETPVAPVEQTPTVAEPVAEETPAAPEAAEAPKEETVPAEAPAPESKAEDTIPDGTQRVLYTIQEGDRLFRIAKRFGVSPEDIVKWNDLPDQNIKFGRTLIIYTPNAQAPAESGAGMPTTTEPPAAPVPAPAAEPVAPAAPVAPEPVTEVPATPVSVPAPAPEAEAPAASATVPDGRVEETADVPKDAAGAPQAGVDVQDGLVRIEHEVQRGEILSRLAKQYGVKQSDIEKWNKLSNPNVQRGQRLVLYVEPDKAQAAPVETVPVPEAVPAAEVAPAPEAVAPAVSAPTAEAPAPAPEAMEYARYRVKPGDTATRLAREHGISVKELLQINGLDDPDRILVDQVIKVPK